MDNVSWVGDVSDPTKPLGLNGFAALEQFTGSALANLNAEVMAAPDPSDSCYKSI